MAKLTYDDNGRLLFTEEMKKEYTVLMPQMLPIHFEMLRKVLELEGFTVELLTTNHRGVVDEGLKYVHNDTCYPALLVIGQFMDAIKSGKYDPHKVALFITQTGGGCRASNYIHLLRKALSRGGYDYVPVISINLSGLEKNPGFSLNLNLIRRMAYSMIYGDLIMHMANQCRPYEIKKGETDEHIDYWVDKLTNGFEERGSFRTSYIRNNFDKICNDFASIPLKRENKVKVGVVGEIYVKYSPLGNNNLEEFLLSENCEPVVPGLTDFILFKCDNRVEDHKIYGGKFLTYLGAGFLLKYIKKLQRFMIEAIEKHPEFRVPCTFDHLKKVAGDYIGYGNKMGEGWLLTGEMVELVQDGIPNIVCTQPFGCLPNHVAGKGMIRKIKDKNPQANIVSIDYDPGATRANQENRIKLMLANAHFAKQEQQQEEKAEEKQTSKKQPEPVPGKDKKTEEQQATDALAI